MDYAHPPECRTCKTTAVLADAGVVTSIPYWYCRPCKCEVDDFGWKVKSKGDSRYDELDEYMYTEISRLDDEAPTPPDPDGYDLQDYDYSGFYPHVRRK